MIPIKSADYHFCSHRIQIYTNSQSLIQHNFAGDLDNDSIDLFHQAGFSRGKRQLNIANRLDCSW